MDDFQLLQDMAKGRHEANKAFTEFHERYKAFVLQKLKRQFGSKYDKLSLSEDLSQEVWLKVVKSAPNFTAKPGNAGSVKSWLGTIVFSVFVDYLRSLKTEQKETWSKEAGAMMTDEALAAEKKTYIIEFEDFDAPELQSSGDVPNPEHTTHMSDCVNQAQSELKTKSEDCFNLLATIAEEKISSKQLSSLLGRKEGAARQFLSHCKKMFSQMLEPCLEA